MGRKALAALALLVLLGLAGVLVLTNTPWGREQVRGLVMDYLDGQVDGRVEIGALEGNLLREPRLVEVTVEDEEGRPFVAAGSISFRYSVPALLRRRILLTRVELRRAHVVLDEPPGEEWNVLRIFAVEPEADPDPEPGWGDRIDLRDVRISDARVTLRTAWEPGPHRPRADREEEIRRALAGETRWRVVEVPAGFQRVMEIRDLHARVPRVLAAHPDTADVPVEVAELRAIAAPFHGPAAEIVHLAGRFRAGAEHLRVPGLELALPGSRLRAEGSLAFDLSEARVRLQADRLVPADLRVLHPPLPGDVEGRARLAVDHAERETRIRLPALDFRVGAGRLAGHLDATLGERRRVDDTRIEFEGIETRFLEELLTPWQAPRPGVLGGHLAADRAGDAGEGARVDALLRFDDRDGPTSRLLARGVVGLTDALPVRDLTLRAAPLQAGLVRGLAPGAPIRGSVEGRVTLDGTLTGPFLLQGDLVHRDPVAGSSRLWAAGGLEVRDPVRLTNMEVHLLPVRLDLLRDHLAWLPPGATVRGPIHLDGEPLGVLQVESELTVDDPATGTSRVAARGGLSATEGPGFQGFEVTLAPLQVRALALALSDGPFGGILQGTTRLDGTPADGLRFRTELIHRDADERSRVGGTGEVATAGPGRVHADLDLHELSLVTAGRFVPEAGLHGAASGPLRLDGTFRDLLLRGTLELPHEGRVEAEGRLELAGEEAGYDLHVGLREVDLAALSLRWDRATSIGGTVAAAGRGTDPATMEGRLDVHLADRAPAEAATLHAGASVRDGLATVDSVRARTGVAEAEARGTFGLVEAREGELTYRVSVDSLQALGPWVVREGGRVAPRPGVRRAALREWEAELTEAVREAEVEILATGRAPEWPEPSDTLAVAGIDRDALVGRLEATGSVRGNPERMDVAGTASAEGLVARGQSLGQGRMEFTLRDLRRPHWSAVVEARGRSLSLNGFGYDSVHVQGTYRESPVADGRDREPPRTGALRFTVDQDEATQVRGAAGFRHRHGEGEAWVEELVLDLPDAVYRTPGPGRVRWTPAGIEVEELALEGDPAGELRVRGRLPREGDGDLEVRIDDLEVSHLLPLLQDPRPIRGRMHLHLPVGGSMARPRFEGEAGLDGGQIGGAPLPDARARFAYEGRDLRVDGSAVEAGAEVLSLEAVLPLDLALVDVVGPRARPEPIWVEARLDGLSLDGLAALTDEVEAVAGRAGGRLAVTGSFREPRVEGTLDLLAPSLFVPRLGIWLSDVAGALRLADGVVAVDSVVAQSRGPVRMTGEVDVRRPAEPVFDLAVEARDVRIMETDDVRMRVDADLSVEGPPDALAVRGGVRTRRGVVRIPETRELVAPGPLDLDDPETFERVDRILVEARDALVEPSPLLEGLRVDLDLLVERDVWIRSRELNVEVYTPPAVGPLAVRMDGLRPMDLTLEGTVNADRGEYEFMGRRFDLARASVTFVGNREPDPFIRLTAEHEVQLPGREAFDIRIILDGTLHELETELESTAQPPLSQTDLLSLVVFGQEAGSLLQHHGSVLSGPGTAGGPLVGALAARATQQFATVGMEALLAEVESETARTLGLDVLHIQPAEAPAEIFTGEALDVLRGTEVRAGRYLTPRLFVSGQARPSFVHPGALLEYHTDTGYRWRATWRPRFLPAVPTLRREPPDRASVFGTFLFREWRF